MFEIKSHRPILALMARIWLRDKVGGGRFFPLKAREAFVLPCSPFCAAALVVIGLTQMSAC